MRLHTAGTVPAQRQSIVQGPVLRPRFAAQVRCAVLLPAGLHLRLPDGCGRRCRRVRARRSRKRAAPEPCARRAEITAFSDRAGEFHKIGAEILGVSVDSQFSHLAWVQTDRKSGGVGDLKYPLVADLKKEISEAYQVLADDGIALRGLFIIDKEGIVQHATINNLGFGRSVDETLRVLQAIQYVQTHPDEVCPAGWKPGAATMKPDPVKSKEYFKHAARAHGPGSPGPRRRAAVLCSRFSSTPAQGSVNRLEDDDGGGSSSAVAAPLRGKRYPSIRS